MSESGPVRIGLADSGINPRHRQVGAVDGGVGIAVRDGVIEWDDDWKDQLGHGTSAAATIHGHAPGARLYAIRIFRRRLEAHSGALLAAIEWAAERRLDVLNLSLGCTERSREPELRAACDTAAERGVVVVAACEGADPPSLPGPFPSVIGVGADLALGDDELRVADGRLLASPWARRLGALPKERNFHGVSFAVAHVSGMIARMLATGESDKERIRVALDERCGLKREV